MDEIKLEPGDLIAYLNDDVSDAVRAYIEADPALLAEADALRELSTSLPTSDAPDALTLAEYQMGTLDEATSAEIAAYLDQSSAEHPELLLFDRFMASLEHADAAPVTPQTSTRPSLRVLLAKLLPPTAAQPAFAVRGEASALMTYVADEVRITIRSASDDAHPNRKRITGMIAGLASGEYALDLIDADSAEQTETITLPVVNAMNFSGGNLPPATYNLILRGEQLEIRIEQVTIAE